MPSFTKTVIAAILGATSVAAIPQYGNPKPTSTTTYPAPTYVPTPECQTKLKNPNMDFSFSPVPIWKEPWVVGTCRGAGDCEFTGVKPFDGSPLDFNGGGHMTTKGATGQIGQSFNLCPGKYDYKLKIRSAVVGGEGKYVAEGTEITMIIQVGEELLRVPPIPLTKGKFSDYVVDIPKSKAGGIGFAFWTAKTDKAETVLVDYVDLV